MPSDIFSITSSSFILLAAYEGLNCSIPSIRLALNTVYILCFKVNGKYITIDADKKIAIPYLLSCGIVKEADIKNVLDIILNIKKGVKQGIF